MTSEHQPTDSRTAHLLRARRRIGDMSTPGQTADQRVMHTSDALFRKFMRMWLVLTTLLCVYSAIWQPATLYATVICVVCSLLAKLALYRGYPCLARWVFITPFFIMLMIAPWLVNGVRTPLLMHMMLLLVFTGWMLGTRVMWVFASALFTMVLTLWYAESHQLWQPPQALRGIDMWLISQLFSILVMAVVMSELIHNYRIDIQREVTWQNRLHHAMQFNALIIDSSPVPIRVFGPHGECMAVNDAYAQLMGEPRDALLSQSLHDNAMQSSGLTAECLHVLETGASAQREVQLTTSDGRALWLGAHLVPFERDGQRHLLAHFIDLTQHRHATQELKQLAFHDSLTGLANRRLFWEHFKQTQLLCARNQTWGAVLLLDLNRFKQLNDQHGHEAGDQMLKEVARRMQQTMRASDVSARLGGDEFTLLLADMGSSEAQARHNVGLLCSKLQAALSQPYQLGSLTYRGSASIGVALINPAEDANLDTLLRQADADMYAQKKSQATNDTALYI